MQELSHMDGDRKFRQHGYQDGNAGGTESKTGSSGRPLTEHFPPPRHVMDVTAPRLPRLVRNVTATRCFACSYALPDGFDFAEPCPKCAAALRCCKQCAFFDSAAHFQCTREIPERIAAKDKVNSCELFSPRVTIARDSNPPPAPPKPVAAAAAAPERSVPRSVHAARLAFENLFKK
jgi:hypothetical protein